LVSLTERFICSSVSAASGEPLHGTASRFRRWLMVEQPGPWGHDALVDSGFPRDVGRSLKRLGDEVGIRVLLIKQRERPVGPRRCFVAYTGAHERRIRSFEVDHAGALLDLDLRGLVERRFSGVGETVDGPIFLVCTHGKHDPCCARYGAPLFRALAGLPTVWECTHIGGDRFAGNLVCFPHGVYYGRVPPGEAVAVARAYEDGRIALGHYRGRSAFSPPVQAAEDAVRREEEIEDVDGLELRRHRRLGRRRHRVEFEATDGTRHVRDVEVTDLPPRPLTCKGTMPGVPRGFLVRKPDVED
jgi:hypothetical protein